MCRNTMLKWSDAALKTFDVRKISKEIHCLHRGSGEDMSDTVVETEEALCHTIARFPRQGPCG